MKTFKQFIKETISKEGDLFVVRSKTGKNLGKSRTRKGAIERLREVEWFKQHNS